MIRAKELALFCSKYSKDRREVKIKNSRQRPIFIKIIKFNNLSKFIKIIKN